MLFHCNLLIYFLKTGIAFYKEYFQVLEVSENLNTSCITAKHLFIKCFVQCLWLSSLIYLMVSFMMFAPFIDEKMSCRVWKTWALCNLSMQPRPWTDHGFQNCYVFVFALCSNNSIFFHLILNIYCGIGQQTDSCYWQYSSVFCQCDIIQGHLGRGTLTEKQCLHQIDLCQICEEPYWLMIGVRGPSPL